MVDFLGSYCEVPLGDDEFLHEHDGGGFQLDGTRQKYSAQENSVLARSQSQVDEEEYLSSRPASRVTRPSFQSKDSQNQSHIEEEAYLTSRPASRVQRRSLGPAESPLQRLDSSASAPEKGLGEMEAREGAEEKDIAHSLTDFDPTEEEEEFNPVSVASMSMFGEAPQSMVTLQLKKNGKQGGSMMERLQELSKLTSGNRETHSPQRPPNREQESLFGSTPRRALDNQAQADATKPESAKANRGLFRAFRRRKETDQECDNKENLPSPGLNRSWRQALSPKR